MASYVRSRATNADRSGRFRASPGIAIYTIPILFPPRFYRILRKSKRKERAQKGRKPTLERRIRLNLSDPPLSTFVFRTPYPFFCPTRLSFRPVGQDAASQATQ